MEDHAVQVHRELRLERVLPFLLQVVPPPALRPPKRLLPVRLLRSWFRLAPLLLGSIHDDRLEFREDLQETGYVAKAASLGPGIVFRDSSAIFCRLLARLELGSTSSRRGSRRLMMRHTLARSRSNSTPRNSMVR